MGLVGILFSVGIGLFGSGCFWKLEEDIINNHLSQYILENAYYTLSDWSWNFIPWALIIAGVICLVGAGVLHNSGGVISE